MSALPSDIALYTTDGVLIVAPTDPAVSAAIAADNINARSSGTSEIVMFYDVAADAQIYLNERFAFLSEVNPLHLGVEVEEALDMGGAIAIAPAVPCFTCVDRDANTAVVARTRAYAHDMGTDRFSLELLA